MVGAVPAEPTENVRAADRSGASVRGEGLGMSSTYDPASFTAARCGAAVRAGPALRRTRPQAYSGGFSASSTSTRTPCSSARTPASQTAAAA